MDGVICYTQHCSSVDERKTHFWTECRSSVQPWECRVKVHSKHPCFPTNTCETGGSADAKLAQYLLAMSRLQTPLVTITYFTSAVKPTVSYLVASRDHTS